jgi:hypothetical protein
MDENKELSRETAPPVEEALKSAGNARNVASDELCGECGLPRSLHKWVPDGTSEVVGALVCPAPAISLPPVEVGPLPHLVEALSQVTSDGAARVPKELIGEAGNREIAETADPGDHKFDSVSLLQDCSCGWRASSRVERQTVEGARAAWKRHVSDIEARAEVGRLTKLINTPEIVDFVKAVQIEAVHQRERWGPDHDDGKSPADWFWLLGYLAGKALNSAIRGDRDKLLHHIITTAAACANWHAQVLGKCDMRPGIKTPVGFTNHDSVQDAAAGENAAGEHR